MLNEDLNSITDSIMGTPKYLSLKGTGILKKEQRSETILFELLCFTSGALICFKTQKFPFGLFVDCEFSGKLENGHSCKGQIADDFQTINDNVIAFCKYLITGDVNSISKIETRLLGIYLPFSLKIDFGKYKINIQTSKHSKSVAKRTQRLTGTILEGNQIIVTSNSINLDEVNEILKSLCILLRPITCSQVYYRAMVINEENLVYLEKYIKGDFFGGDYKMLERKSDYEKYLNQGLKKLEKLTLFDFESINDIGHSLAISCATELLELKLTTLIVSLERLGSSNLLQKKNNSEVWNSLNKELKTVKNRFKNNFKAYIEKNPKAFNEMQISCIKDSIGKITAWDEIFQRKINNHFLRNSWEISLDLIELKTIRDELMHSGELPVKITKEYGYDLSKKLELYLFVHILDILEIDADILTTREGWVKFNQKSQFKKGIIE